MKRLRKFLLLTSTDRRLLVRATLLVWVIRFGLWLLPFQTLRRLLARVAQAPAGWRNSGSLSPDRIAWAVAVASRYVPGAGTCLTHP
ncbi:MAG: lasso peptide biosynthesis B2 protein [Candidatus Bipolaricaulia bacterium]